MMWLITGGAGYIGGHVVRALRASGRKVTVLDDLSSGLRERVPDVPFVEASLLDPVDTLTEIMLRHQVTGIVHLAAKKAVEESVERPLYYFEQNVTGTVALLQAAVRAGVCDLLYSSSAAVYGETGGGLVNENVPTVPTSPYGESKLAAEWLAQRTADAHGMRWAALRYFNVAGAADATLADRGVSNLLPIVLRNVVLDRETEVFGGDWPTRDGSCVRDYVHVEDLADAHCAAVDGFSKGVLRAGAFNVGRGDGVSVLEMLAAVERVVGRPVARRVVRRRAGDPAAVVADVSRIESVLGWRARRSVDDIVASAWKAVAAAD